MKDKEKLLEAIEDYTIYTPKQRELLKILVGISVDNIAVITPLALTKLLNTTKATIYHSIKCLTKDGIIQRDNTKSSYRFGEYHLNSEKLKSILTSYENKLKYFSKSF